MSTSFPVNSFHIFLPVRLLHFLYFRNVYDFGVY